MTGAKSHSVETHLFITGTVQGVFFRSKTKTHADHLGLKEYVKNLPDGRVEICVEGEKVNELIDFLKKEPSPASIDHIERETRPLQGGLYWLYNRVLEVQATCEGQSMHREILGVIIVPDSGIFIDFDHLVLSPPIHPFIGSP